MSSMGNKPQAAVYLTNKPSGKLLYFHFFSVFSQSQTIPCGIWALRRQLYLKGHKQSNYINRCEKLKSLQCHATKQVPDWQLLHEGSTLICFLRPRELSASVSEEKQSAGCAGLAPVEQTATFLKAGAAPGHYKLNSQSHILTPVSS